MSTHPLPFLSFHTQHDLDEAARQVVGEDSFAALAARCYRSDQEALATGGLQGWRPSGPDALVLRLALEVVDHLRDTALAGDLVELGKALKAKLREDEQAAYERARVALGLAPADPKTSSECPESRAGREWAEEYLAMVAHNARAFFRARFDRQPGFSLARAYTAYLFALDEHGFPSKS